MSAEQDPPRLRTLGSELPRGLAVALRGSPHEEATVAQLARVRAAVNARIPALAPHRSRAPVLARALALAGTLAIGAGAGVLVSGGVFLVQRGIGRNTDRVAPSPAPPPSTQVRAPSVPESAPAEPQGGPSASASVRVTSRAPTGGRPQSVPNGASASASSRTEPSPPPSPASSASPDELNLLARAQNALSSDPTSALALAAQHAREFPAGALVQEREVIAIDALLRLNQTAEASVRATRFHRRFSSSAHRRRVDVLFELRGLTKP